MKSYYDFMNEISADELYDGLLDYGLFADKILPIKLNNLTYNKLSKADEGICKI